MKKALLAVLPVWAILVPSCGGSTSSADRICQKQEGAKVCVSGLANKTETKQIAGSGFQPNSEYVLDLQSLKVPTSDSKPVPQRTDDRGAFPPNNVTSGLVIPTGTAPVTVVVAGRSASGSPVTIRLVVQESP